MFWTYCLANQHLSIIGLLFVGQILLNMSSWGGGDSLIFQITFWGNVEGRGSLPKLYLYCQWEISVSSFDLTQIEVELL